MSAHGWEIPDLVCMRVCVRMRKSRQRSLDILCIHTLKWPSVVRDGVT